jgi:dihydroxyacetone kinase
VAEIIQAAPQFSAGVDDDVAVKDSLYTAGRRGVANTVLIEKLVGAAAERTTTVVTLMPLSCSSSVAVSKFRMSPV